MAWFNVMGSIFQPSETKPSNTAVYSPKEKFTGKGKLSKSDIGTPTNFKHVTHVGFSAMSGLDECSDLKRLLNLAGVQEEQLKNKAMFYNLLDAIEKEGMESVQKMTRGMTSVERPTTCTRLHSLSSSFSIAPSKQQNVPESRTHANEIATTLSDGCPFSYLQFQSKVPPTLSTPKTSGHLNFNPPSPSVPPYLGELSSIISSANNFTVHPLHKDVHLLPPRPKFSKNAKNFTPLKPSNSETSGVISYFTPPSTVNNATVPESNNVCPDVDPFAGVERNVLPSCQPSVPGDEFFLPKFGVVPPFLPPVSKCFNSETSISLPLCSEPLQSKMLYHETTPPTAPLQFKMESTSITRSRNCSSEHFLNSSDCQADCQVDDVGHSSDLQEIAASSELVTQKNETTLFLDQIRQGVQLKSIGKMTKMAPAENYNFISVIRDVIQKRHKAIHSSDEENNEEEDEWED